MIAQADHDQPALVCGICGRNVLLRDGTIASAYADGRPAVAHEIHREDYLMWVMWWLAFSQPATIATPGFGEPDGPIYH